MNALPRELTAPWEADCRRCGERTLGAFGSDGRAVVLDALPVYGGGIELMRLSVGFRAKRVEALGDVERYAPHQCSKPGPVRSESDTGDDARAARYTLMPFGKHRGEYLEDVPAGYLRWCLENAEIREPALRRAIERVVEQHDGTRGDGEDMPA